MRPNWDDYFFGIAKAVSARSTCPSRQVGAVLIDPESKAILSTGYNGAPKGLPHCGDSCATRESGKSWEKCNSIHGELNVITYAAKNGVKINGSWLYITTTPCVFCARIIINAGIERVYASSVYPQQEAITLLKQGGVRVFVIQGVPMPILRTREDKK